MDYRNSYGIQRILFKKMSLISTQLVFHQNEKSFIKIHQISYVYEGRWEITATPSKTKTKYLFITVIFDYYQVFAVEGRSLFGTFQSRRKKRKMFSSWKEPERGAYSTFPTQNNTRKPNFSQQIARRLVFELFLVENFWFLTLLQKVRHSWRKIVR